MAIAPQTGLQREITYFLQDVSGSMLEPYDQRLSKIEGSRRAAGSMAVNKERLDANDEVGVIAFHTEARLVLSLTCLRTGKQTVLQALQWLTAGGGTDINTGLKLARDTFEWHRTDVVRRIVLLTDGHGGDPLHTAAWLKNRGVVIDVVGVGADPSGVDERLLRRVASVIQGETRYRFIKDSQTLVKYYTALANKTAIA